MQVYGASAGAMNAAYFLAGQSHGMVSLEPSFIPVTCVHASASQLSAFVLNHARAYISPCTHARFVSARQRAQPFSEMHGLLQSPPLLFPPTINAILVAIHLPYIPEPALITPACMQVSLHACHACWRACRLCTRRTAGTGASWICLASCP